MHAKEIDIKNEVYNYCFDILIKGKKIETIAVLFNEKHYNNLVIYFTRYIHSKSRKMLSLHYHELNGKIEEHERNKHLIVDDYMLDKV